MKFLHDTFNLSKTIYNKSINMIDILKAKLISNSNYLHLNMKGSITISQMCGDISRMEIGAGVIHRPY